MKKPIIKAIAAVLLTSSLLTCTACGSSGKTSDSSTVPTASESTPSPAESSEKASSAESTSAPAENSEKVSSSESTPDTPDESSKKESAASVPEKKDDPTDAKEQGNLPDLPDSDGTDVGQMIDGVLLYGRTAYELFFGNDSLAKDYAAAISNIKKALGSSVKVYNVIVPTHCGVTLPERFFDAYDLPDQNAYINTILNSYTEDIIGINPYNTLAHHRDEYLYFNTDHHWTGLAAYYAYKDFCKAAGIDYLRLENMIEGTIDGYYGSLTNYVDPSLVDADTVHYYTLDADTSTSVFDDSGENEQPSRLMHSYAEGIHAYGVFLGGDNPLMVCKNKDGNGKKIAVVKESYGNAFCPYIALTYSETHMIDFRYIEFDFQQYLKDHQIDEVIFVNNTMASATGPRVDELNALVS